MHIFRHFELVHDALVSVESYLMMDLKILDPPVTSMTNIAWIILYINIIMLEWTWMVEQPSLAWRGLSRSPVKSYELRQPLFRKLIVAFAKMEVRRLKAGRQVSPRMLISLSPSPKQAPESVRQSGSRSRRPFA
jgi:hypothetical protein